MAITRAETQVTWTSSPNTSASVTAGSSQTSDLVSLDATCVNASITCKADNAGTPASGDIITFYWAASSGDPDGAATIEHPSNAANMEFLCQIDTFTYTDPDVKTISIPAVPYRGKVVAVSGAASNAITVSATIEEQRAA